MGYFRPARVEGDQGDGIVPARRPKILKIWTKEEGGAGGISLTDALMTKTRHMI